MDFRHLIVTCLFSMLRLSFETQKIKENYAIFIVKSGGDYRDEWKCSGCDRYPQPDPYGKG